MKKLICLTACFLVFIALHAQVTIENLLSVPFPSELKASADGKHIAWITDDKGSRNIFIADAPGFPRDKLQSITLMKVLILPTFHFLQMASIFYLLKEIH